MVEKVDKLSCRGILVVMSENNQRWLIPCSVRGTPGPFASHVAYKLLQKTDIGFCLKMQLTLDLSRHITLPKRQSQGGHILETRNLFISISVDIHFLKSKTTVNPEPKRNRRGPRRDSCGTPEAKTNSKQV